jgi:hypothetical protein
MQALVIKIVAALLLVCALAGLSVGLYQQHNLLTLTRTQLDEQTTLVQGLRASQARIQISVADVRRVSDSTARSVRKALDDQPAFRDTPVPRSVADGLCGRLRCVP